MNMSVVAARVRTSIWTPYRGKRLIVFEMLQPYIWFSNITAIYLRPVMVLKYKALHPRDGMDYLCQEKK